MKLLPLYPLVATSLILSACAGGGGGGGSSTAAVTTSPFTSWSAIRPNTNFQFNDAASTQFTYTANPTTGIVSSITNNGISGSGGYVSLTYGGSSDLTAIAITSRQGQNLFVSAYAGDTISTIAVGPVTSIVYGINKERTTEVVGINGPSFGWDYQTYGVWVTGEGTGSGTAGAVSAGNVTAVTGIPATGTAVFSGNALGVFGIVGAPAYLTAAAMSANTNFGSRTIAFATSGTVASSFNGGGAFSAPGLNMSGNLTYGAGVNQFSGAVTASNGMSGSAVGKFYGPNANEIGGTYNLSGGGAFMGGGFGGKR